MVLKKKIVARVIELEFVCQTSAFFLTWYLIDRCQIVTDTYSRLANNIYLTNREALTVLSSVVKHARSG